MSTHTPTRWRAQGELIIADRNQTCVAKVLPGVRGEGPSNARRIVACVNALEGIDDPAAARAVLDDPRTSAATDMLQALRALMLPTTKRERDAAEEMAKCAIAKASALMLVVGLFAGCGSAPSAALSAAASIQTAPVYTVTCPGATSLVQNTTCEETTPRAAVTQVAAAGFCAQAEMHLCSIAERVGVHASAHQETAGTAYWLSDTAMGGDGFTVNDGQASAVAGGTFQYFCCVTGAVTL